MSGRFYAWALVCMGLLGLASCQRARPRTAEEILKEQGEHLASVKDEQFTVVQTLQMAEHPLTTEAEVIFKTPDRFHIQTKLQGMSTTVEQTLISDGKTMWIASNAPQGNQIVRFDLTKIPARSLLGRQGVPLTEMLDPARLEGVHQELLSQFEPKVLRPENVEGKKADVLEFSLKSTPEQGSQAAPMISRMKLWIGQKDGFQYREEIYDKEGKLVMTQEARDVLLNRGISEERFQYTPPPGEKVTDGLEMMHGMGGMGGMR